MGFTSVIILKKYIYIFIINICILLYLKNGNKQCLAK